MADPNWSPTLAETQGLMIPAPVAIRIIAIARPSRVWSSVRTMNPMQYTTENHTMVLNFPNHRSEMTAPTMDMK